LDLGVCRRFLEAARFSLFQNVQIAFEVYQVSYPMVSGSYHGRGEEMTPYHHLGPRLRIRGDIPSLPHMQLRLITHKHNCMAFTVPSPYILIHLLFRINRLQRVGQKYICYWFRIGANFQRHSPTT